MTSALPALHDQLRQDGFAFVAAAAMRELLDAASLPDWSQFTASWDALAPDAYLASVGRHRRRRHAVFLADAQGIQRAAHQPHYQSLAYNTLQGDLERWFEPVQAMGRACGGCSASATPASALWRRRSIAGMWKSISSASRHARMRPASRRPKACIATASTTCWCC